MSPNRHSITAVSTARKLNTPLKASVVLLTAIILASCSSSGRDNTITPKPTPVLPGNGGTETTIDEGNTGGSGNGGVGVISEAEKAIKAAETAYIDVGFCFANL